METDYLVVGSGLTGAVIARLLRDAGERVIVVESRSHIGGSVHDHTHQSGIRVHTYGPHFFRTSSEKIWSFVNRFATFYPFEAVIKSYVDGRPENWPVAAEYVKRTIGNNWKPEFCGEPKNFEENSLSMMPRAIYEKFVKGYTEKQWGVRADSLSANLAKRFNVRLDNDPRLVVHKYQGLPVEGYTSMMKKMLSRIQVILNFDYLKARFLIKPKKMLIFTRPIDAYFSYKLGRLSYRSQSREHIYFENIYQYQPFHVINNPLSDHGAHIRTIEWKNLMEKKQIQHIRGTLITRETPIDPTDNDHLEYPFPDEKNQLLYQQYKKMAEADPRILICGRLGEYRYYDMDQAIARAFVLAEQILAQQLKKMRKEESYFKNY